MKTKLVDPWWDRKLNTITGFKSETKADTRHGNIIDEKKYYNVFPKLEI